jgi:hypothetical protein
VQINLEKILQAENLLMELKVKLENFMNAILLYASASLFGLLARVEKKKFHIE